MLLLEKNAMRARGQSLTRTCLAVGRNRDPRRTAEDAGGAPLTRKLRALGSTARLAALGCCTLPATV